MGFRSTFTIEHYPIKWPQWFVDKYESSIYFPNERGIISPKFEAKTYMTWGELDADIQKSIDWEELKTSNIIVVYLHECGGITRAQISKDNIQYSEPNDWNETDGVTHNYCYGCSDLPTNNTGMKE